MDIEVACRVHGQALLAYFCARVQQVDAEDLLQKVWIAALKRPDSLAGIDLRRWLFRVAHNEWVSFVRKNATGNEVPLGGIDPPLPPQPDDGERIAALRACIEKLSKEFRKVVQGRLRGESSKDIATQVGTDAAAVDKQFYMAKKELMKCPGANEP
jgi:RNA polymerase sigma-70 factor, ECF subfamily